MTLMRYKGYEAGVTFDPDAEIFHGEVVNLIDVVTFQGTSVAELKRAFADSIEDYLAFCAERGEAPERPFSGRFLVRTEPTLHRDLVNTARRKGLSLNALAVAALEKAVR